MEVPPLPSSLKHGMTPQQLEAEAAFVEKLFKSFDENHDRLIVSSELRHLLWSVGLHDETIDALFTFADKNGDHQLSYTEFLSWVSWNATNDEREHLAKATQNWNTVEFCRRIFLTLDKSMDGKISKAELSNVFKLMNWTSNEVEALMKDMDSNKDGYVSYDEFVSWRFRLGSSVSSRRSFHELAKCFHQEDAECSFIVHPQNRDVLVIVRSAAGRVELQASAVLAISLEGLPDGCYTIEAYVDGGGFKLLLQTFEVVKERSMLSPSFFDTGASTQRFVVEVKNKCLPKAEVTIQRENEWNSLQYMTDSEGAVVVTLPPNTYNVKVLRHSAEVATMTAAVSDRPLLHAPPLPFLSVGNLDAKIHDGKLDGHKSIAILKDCTENIFRPIPLTEESYVALLADTSGSMGRMMSRSNSMSRIDCLKKNLPQLRDRMLAARCTGQFYSFKSELSHEKCAIPGPGLDDWIRNLKEDGGTNMPKAVEDVLNDFLPHVPMASDVDVVILGAGDVGFSLSDWSEFLEDYPKKAHRDLRDVRFHFLAWGAEADKEKMQRMAIAGSGQFILAT